MADYFEWLLKQVRNEWPHLNPQKQVFLANRVGNYLRKRLPPGNWRIDLQSRPFAPTPDLWCTHLSLEAEGVLVRIRVSSGGVA